MEDFLKFLLIAGVILVGIFKEVSKNKAKKAADKRPAPHMPPQPEVAPDAIPLPEAWGKMFPSEDIFNPKPVVKPANKPSKMQKSPKKQDKKQDMTENSSLAGTLGTHKFSTTEQPTVSHPQHEGSSDTENDFTIHSAEEARRAIIWGEILQRKY